MQTFKRICVKDYTITDDTGAVFTLRRGKEYLTSAIGSASAIVCPGAVKDHVVVFSEYWVNVPADIFAGAIEFTPA